MRNLFIHGIMLSTLGCTKSTTQVPTLYELPEVPINGGTSEQRSAIRDELLDFDGWVGPGRLKIQQIKVQKIDDGYRGRYLSGGIVLVNKALSETRDIRQLVRHELCHALDEAEELYKEPFPILDEVADQLKQTDELDIEASDQFWRKEAFAQNCEIDPFVGYLLTKPCLREDPRISDIASWLQTYVWNSFTSPPQVSLGKKVVFQNPMLNEEPLEAYIVESIDAEVVNIEVDYGDLVRSFSVDVRTGQTVPEEVETASPPYSSSLPKTTPLTGFLIPYGTPEETLFIEIVVEVSVLGLARDRAAWYGLDNIWHPIGDTCLDWTNGNSGLFIADSEAWMYQLEDGQLFWAPIEDRF